MIEAIVDFSVRRRWLVLLVTIAIATSGIWSVTRLPIDAVPDITNVQVQVNAVAPALTPVEIEKQVTVALETALAGIPGMESTRSSPGTDLRRSPPCLPTAPTSTSRANWWRSG